MPPGRDGAGGGGGAAAAPEVTAVPGGPGGVGRDWQVRDPFPAPPAGRGYRGRHRRGGGSRAPPPPAELPAPAAVRAAALAALLLLEIRSWRGRRRAAFPRGHRRETQACEIPIIGGRTQRTKKSPQANSPFSRAEWVFVSLQVCLNSGPNHRVSEQAGMTVAF